LRRAGLVETRKDGLWVHYRLASNGDDATRPLVDAVFRCIRRLPTVAKDCRRLQKTIGCCTTGTV